MQVDEAWAGDIHLPHVAMSAQRLGDQLRELSRLPAQALGQHHGGVSGEITVRGIARQFHRHPGNVDLAGNLPSRLKRLQRRRYLAMEIRKWIHHAPAFPDRRCCSSSAKLSVMPAM